MDGGPRTVTLVDCMEKLSGYCEHRTESGFTGEFPRGCSFEEAGNVIVEGSCFRGCSSCGVEVSAETVTEHFNSQFGSQTSGVSVHPELMRPDYHFSG